MEVKLRPEPTNEKDKNAIAIDINHGSGYFHCGYIASELTQYLHPLIAADEIVDVSLEHIKSRVYFAKMGYYPKVLRATDRKYQKSHDGQEISDFILFHLNVPFGELFSKITIKSSTALSFF